MKLRGRLRQYTIQKQKLARYENRPTIGQQTLLIAIVLKLPALHIL